MSGLELPTVTATGAGLVHVGIDYAGRVHDPGGACTGGVGAVANAHGFDNT